jgi:predicted acyl esterase
VTVIHPVAPLLRWLYLIIGNEHDHAPLPFRTCSALHMSTELDTVKRGYVLVEMNERGHFFCEGDYDILAF